MFRLRSFYIPTVFAALLLCGFSPVMAERDRQESGGNLQNMFNTLWSTIAPRPTERQDQHQTAQAKAELSGIPADHPLPARRPENAAAVAVNVHIHDFSFPESLEQSPQQKPLPKDPDIRLTEEDKRIYRKVFAAQNRGDWDAADEKLTKLSDLRLLGYIAYHRYMHPDYNTDRHELAGWLDVYGHYAVADDVFRLAQRKFGSGFTRPPSKRTLAHQIIIDDTYVIHPYRASKRRSAAETRQVRELQRQISADLSRDRPTAALKKLQEAPARRHMDDVEYDIAKSDIAAAYFYLHLFDNAADLASTAARRSGDAVPMAGWIAGLTAWHRRDYAAAAEYFVITAESQRSSVAMRAASSYWAARAHLRNGRPRIADHWMKNAAASPRSFYGLIARQNLGMRGAPFDWSLPDANVDTHIAPVLQKDSGRRAVALLDAGQPALAVEELQTVQFRGSGDDLRQALFILAGHYEMPGLSMQLASTVRRPDGRLYDHALYPVSPWEPKGGFEISPALVNAFIRQESRFDPHVESRSGALGLMQLMPATASYIAGKPPRFFRNPDGQELLLEPEYNLELGQSYILRLMQYGQVGDNLLKLVAAYNAGPGRLARWHRKMAELPGFEDDPLMFLAMIPAVETRIFTEQVMANYWIYNLRLHGRMPESLRKISAGDWPSYAEDRQIEMAGNRTRSRGGLFRR